ncbi:acetyltransferase [Candidatus Kinetoplastibacterium oncopeltii TCC290E]|uniref:Acetyltransferase n=1 Tax=Candidatus Kinetoplastidibacterium stringomonadis TCC290E TaxID=1208920 RepID=M1M9F5_9PROT|nr:GNAT family N-acetyltransferase [Candidatus Kinetoplastibacterium oncopeltii]AGF48590.1 acetyltransferase [Candidatus Kinetoplastibacterium oncopeltii TCC290E]
MSRHFLSPLLEPSSLLLCSDKKINNISLPDNIKKNLICITCLQNRDLSIKYYDKYNINIVDSIDLIIVCVPNIILKETLYFLRQFNPKAAIILNHDASVLCSKEIKDLCKKWAIDCKCELLGPDSFGIQRPSAFLNLSPNFPTVRSGRVALISQSRSIVSVIIDWAAGTNVGFSLVLFTGKETSLSLSKVIDYLIWDYYTDSIVLYLENIDDVREFISALRALARIKPVIVVKAGHHDYDDIVFSVVMRRTGAVRMRYFSQLFSAVKVLAYPNKLNGRKIALLSNGTGPLKLALDKIYASSMLLKSNLSENTINSIKPLFDKLSVFDCCSIIVDRFLDKDIVIKILNLFLSDDNIDGILVLLAPDYYSDMLSIVEALTKIISEVKKPIITCLMGDFGIKSLGEVFGSSKIPIFQTPESSAYAMNVLAEHYYNQQLLLQVQPSIPFYILPNLDDIRSLFSLIISNGRHTLNQQEIKTMFNAFDMKIKFSLEGKFLAGSSGPIEIRVWRDNIFGPVIQLGVSIIKNNYKYNTSTLNMEIPPLNNFLAGQLIERSNVFINKSDINHNHFRRLQLILVQISEMLIALPDIYYLCLGPFFITNSDIVSDHSSVEIIKYGNNNLVNIDYPHMAIHPYPSDLVKTCCLKDETICLVRPIRPEDAEMLQDFIRGLSDRSRYMRFISAMRELTPRMLSHYTQIDYQRELALVAIINESDGKYNKDVMIGFVHCLCNEDGLGVEYALVVGDNWQRLGLGNKLMIYMIDAAKKRGFKYIDGFVLSNNRPMLALLKNLGFISKADPEDRSICRVYFNLNKY